MPIKNKIKHEITKDQAKTLFCRRLNPETFESCDSFSYEDPNGVGATGYMGFLWGYKGDNCLFCSATFDKLDFKNSKSKPPQSVKGLIKL